LWTLDSPAHTWAGLSSTARLRLRHSDGTVQHHAIGVAELVTAEDGRALMAALVAKGVTATCTPPRGPRYGALDVDSNLPDVRIMLGDNDFAAEVLDNADPGYREALARNGRVFVPASRARQEQHVPGADLRGARDLPALIVTGDVSDLITDLGDACVEVDVPAGLLGTSEPLQDHSVAVVNRGTPGFVVAPDGTLHVALMRSCSGWPANVWIDGERRTVPDGSSFAWQHWSHTFELSLLSGAGDWRQAGFSRSGQDVNHPVRARQVRSGTGPLPRELSLISVSPPEVLLTAIKPTGTPLASGAPAETDPASGITVRLYESTGTPVTATVSVHGGLLAAHRTNLIEEGHTGALTLHNGQASVPLTAADVATLCLMPSEVQPESGAGLARSREPVQPVFTRYWRHNAGPAPIGNLPVSVHVSPPLIRLDPGDTKQVRVTVSCSSRPAAGTVELDGLGIEDKLAYDLTPDGFAEFMVQLRAPDEPGRYLFAARIRDDLGQLLEDTTEVVVGAVPAEENLVAVQLGGDVLEIAPGGRVQLPVSLTNLTQSEVHGEVTVISPYGTWDDHVHIGPRAQAFTIPADARTAVSIVAMAAPTARVGAHWWTLVRVTCHGRLYYSPAIAVRIGGRT
jgi:hypothetical protein